MCLFKIKIKKQVFVIAIWFISICSTISAEEIIFASLPLERPEKIFREMRPFLDYIGKELDVSIKIQYYKNYKDIVSNFKEEKIDLVLLGPLPYIQLRKLYSDADPVVLFLNSKGESTYTCSLITGIESGIEFSGQLKGEHIALTQPLSTCGYYSVNNLLSKEGIDISDTLYRYLGTHENVVLSVVRHEFAAGGVKTAIAKRFEHLGIRFLGETGPMPGFALIANGRTLNPEQIEMIKRKLLELDPLNNSVHKKITEDWGNIIKYGTAVVSDEDYSEIRQSLGDIVIPDKGNF